MLIGCRVSQSHGGFTGYTCVSSSRIFTLFCVARYGTVVPRVPRGVQLVHLALTLGSQRTKEAFRNWLRYFVFVYQRSHTYEEEMHDALSFNTFV